MKGFFKRDLCLLLANSRFYLLFLVVMAAVCRQIPRMTGFLTVYVMVLAASVTMNLFNYDMINGWGAYAAAVPGGRRVQVDARYLSALVVAALAAAFQTLSILFSGVPDQLSLVLLYLGVMLIYLDLLLPLTYRFEAKSRLILILLVAVTAGLMGAGGSIAAIAGGPGGDRSFLTAAGAALVLPGAVGMVISHRVSRAIMARKEF